jgi:hypothetical protein
VTCQPMPATSVQRSIAGKRPEISIGVHKLLKKMNARRRLLPFLFGLILASVVTGVDNVSSSQLRQDRYRDNEGAQTRHLREPLREQRRLPEESMFNIPGDWSPEKTGALSGLFFLLLIVFILYCCCGCSLCDILMLFCCWELCCDQGMVDTM